MRSLLLASALVITVIFAGCGGGGQTASSTPPPNTQPPDATDEVGPFVIESAATSSLTIESLPNEANAAFTTLSGGPMHYVAVQEMLDRIVCRYNGITISDMWGGNAQTVPGTDQYDMEPAWSPDGTKIAFANRSSFSENADIYIVDADGGNLTPITDDPGDDRHPTWSPDGGHIAFQSDRSGNWHIYTADVAGTYENQISSGSGNYLHPEYRPDQYTGELVFVTNVFGPTEVCTASEYDFGSRVRLTHHGQAGMPTWSPDGNFIAYQRWDDSGGQYNVHEMTSYGNHVRVLAAWNDYDLSPSYSSSGDYVFYQRNMPGYEIHALERTDPTFHYPVIGKTANWPDLGSPTVQTSRVLIGSPGTDRGYDPVHAHAIAAVVAYDEDGYLNFVRLGIPPDRLNSLNVTPLEGTGQNLVGVVWSAPDMFYVEQDEGAGRTPTIWDLSGRTSRSIILYLNANTGKLVSILDLNDSITTAAAGDSLVHEQTATGATVRGDFRAVYGPDGELVAEGEVGAVEIDAAGGVVRAF